MRRRISILSIIGIMILVGCQSWTAESMVLLDEKISKIHISKSNGFGGMNENIMQSFTDKNAIDTFKHVITTAQKQKRKVDIGEPEYDIMVEYTSEDGQLPTHGIHLWVGKKGEKSKLMYIGDDKVYLTSTINTDKLRSLLGSGI